MLLQKLFKKPDNRINALREVMAINETEANWRKAFYKEAESLQYAASAAFDTFKADPNDTTAKQAMDLARENILKGDALRRLANDGIPEVQARNERRTRPVLRAALEAVAERLKAEIAAMLEKDADTAKEFELSVTETRSPFIATLENELRRVEVALTVVDTSNATKLKTLSTLCVN